MINVTAKDFKDAYLQVNNHFIFGGPLEFERSGVTAHHTNNTIIIESPVCDLQLSDVGYAKQKWGMLTRLYFDPEAFGMFISRLKHYEKKFKYKYLPHIAMQFKERGNVSGACLLAMSLGYTQEQGLTLQVFTRASEVSTRWLADFIFMSKMIQEIDKHMRYHDMADLKIVWHACGMYQSIISAPLFLLKFNPEGMEKLLAMTEEDYENKWQASIVRRYNKCYVGDNPYASYRSQRRSVAAVDSTKVVPNEILHLPKYDLVDGDDDFFEKKGFR